MWNCKDPTYPLISSPVAPLIPNSTLYKWKFRSLEVPTRNSNRPILLIWQMINPLGDDDCSSITVIVHDRLCTKLHQRGSIVLEFQFLLSRKTFGTKPTTYRNVMSQLRKETRNENMFTSGHVSYLLRVLAVHYSTLQVNEVDVFSPHDAMNSMGLIRGILSLSLKR